MMQITLSPEQTQILETLVERGQYPSPEEALNTALLLLIEAAANPSVRSDSEYFAWIEATRPKIDTALRQASGGEVLEADVVLAQLRAKVQKAKERAT
jgi:Arc/MetJ-type ribon-helix-helix transcriptional regulator